MKGPLKTKIDEIALEWVRTPSRLSGSALVQLNSEAKVEVAWRKDAHGIQVWSNEFAFGFDILVHEEEGVSSLEIRKRGNSFEDGANSWKVTCQLGEYEPKSLQQTGKNKAAKVKAQMPGRILRILIEPGHQVEKGQPLLVMEAMKMENEIRASESGKISKVLVSEGQAVETGAELVRLEAAT